MQLRRILRGCSRRRDSMEEAIRAIEERLRCQAGSTSSDRSHDWFHLAPKLVHRVRRHLKQFLRSRLYSRPLGKFMTVKLGHSRLILTACLVRQFRRISQPHRSGQRNLQEQRLIHLDHRICMRRLHVRRRSELLQHHHPLARQPDALRDPLLLLWRLQI